MCLHPLHSQTNYRTHSGIIDVASSIVDLLKHYFPRHIDNLDRERAFFNGPAPLLLSSLSVDDISILLSGSDRNTSQVNAAPHHQSAAGLRQAYRPGKPLTERAHSPPSSARRACLH